jgi:hypothetical protein
MGAFSGVFLPERRNGCQSSIAPWTWARQSEGAKTHITYATINAKTSHGTAPLGFGNCFGLTGSR